MTIMGDERALLGKQVEVYLGTEKDERVVVTGKLLTVADSGEFTVEDDSGFVHYCWPLLGIRELGEIGTDG